MRTIHSLTDITVESTPRQAGSFDALGMVTGVSTGEKMLTFLTDAAYLDALISNPRIAAVVTTQDLAERILRGRTMGILVSPTPKGTFYRIHNQLALEGFYGAPFPNEIHPSAVIQEGARIGKHSIRIEAHAVVEAGAILHPGVRIGQSSIVRSGAILGAQGFYFLQEETGVLSVATAGSLRVGNHVEILHGATICKGVFGGETLLQDHVKVDSQVHLAHDVRIEARTLLGSGAHVAGRVHIGEACWIGPHATLTNGIRVGEGARISLGSVVTRDVQAGTVVSGNFAIDHGRFLEHLKRIR